MAAGRGAGSARWGMLRALGLALRAATRPGAPGMAERLAAVPRMVRAAMSGQYEGVSRGRLLGMLAAVLYVVSPVDLVPESLFTVLGLADDAMLVTWLATALINDTEAFIGWERSVGWKGRGAAPGAPYASAQASPQDATWKSSQSGSASSPQDAPAAGPGSWTVQSHVVH